MLMEVNESRELVFSEESGEIEIQKGDPCESPNHRVSPSAS
ncbi:MAG: hypothetical protein ACE5Z5_11620 [Candidatus Bathyarchaeia archaeon]